MSDYLDRLDSYYPEGESYYSMQRRLNKFKSECQIEKCVVFRFRYYDCQIIIDNGRNNRFNEIYIKDNKKFFIGACGDICNDIIEINHKIYRVNSQYEYYDTSCDEEAIERYRQVVINYLNKKIDDVKSSSVNLENCINK